MPSDEGGDTSHGFKFRAPVGRYVHVLVKEGVQGTGGYISGKPYVATVKVEPYPRALTFLGEGALLSLDRRSQGRIPRRAMSSTVRDRDWPRAAEPAAAPRAADVGFLAARLYGDLEDRSSSGSSTTRDYRGKAAGQADLRQHRPRPVPAGSIAANGAASFLLRIRAVRRRAWQSTDEERHEGGEYGRRGRPIEDTRLILVTDLGFIVKGPRTAAATCSCSRSAAGCPSPARASSWSAPTACRCWPPPPTPPAARHLPAAAAELAREKRPQMVLGRDGRRHVVPAVPQRTAAQLDLSRFDTGGVENAESAQQLSTYLFSDRGIYRPGETTHLGLITRSADWRASLAGLPLDVEITDPRGSSSAARS